MHAESENATSGEACLASGKEARSDASFPTTEHSRPRHPLEGEGTPPPLRRTSTHYLMAPPRLMIQANVEWQEVWVDIWISVPEESLVHSASIQFAVVNWAKVRGAVGGRIFCNGQAMAAF